MKYFAYELKSPITDRAFLTDTKCTQERIDHYRETYANALRQCTLIETVVELPCGNAHWPTGLPGEYADTPHTRVGIMMGLIHAQMSGGILTIKTNLLPVRSSFTFRVCGFHQGTELQYTMILTKQEIMLARSIAHLANRFCEQAKLTLPSFFKAQG